MKQRPATRVTHAASGPAAPSAMNTAPPVTPARPIAGFAKLKKATPRFTSASGPGTSSPSAAQGSAGINAPADSPARKRMSGGPSRPGALGTSGGGTSSPRHGPGPGGMGDSGGNYPPIQGGG